MPVLFKNAMTSEQLKKFLDYDPETGLFTWKERPDLVGSWNTRFAGKQAGYVNTLGYIGIRLAGRLLAAHRLAWLYFYGDCPGHIDHINGTRSDNRIGNLRLAPGAINQANHAKRSNAISGFRGIHLDGRYHNGRPWKAEAHTDGRRVFIGSFSTLNAAVEARHEWCKAHQRGYTGRD